MTPSPPPSDRELLAAFVKTADGIAFAALTERHLGLVLGTACRRTGSREMAQEAAQNTFCRLARHAPRIWIGTSLAPWLHAVALREAGTLMRAESSRKRALHRLAVLTDSGSSNDSPPTAPPPGSEHLDEALAALPEAARRVLILRYLQGLSLREVALEEDTSEEAARKRITRALDRLTRLLARRGVTASAVTACLAAAPLLWPAPSAAAFAGRALKQTAAPAGASLSGLAGFALSHWPAAAVFLLTAVPAAWPWGEASRLDAREGRSIKVSGGSGPTFLPDRSPEPPPSPAKLAVALQRRLQELRTNEWRQQFVRHRAGKTFFQSNFAERAGDALKLTAMRRAVLDLSLEEIRASAAVLDGKASSPVDKALYSRWAELMPDEARRAATAHAARTKTNDALEGVLSRQARSDPAGAVQWAVQHSAGEGHDKQVQSTLLVQSILQPLIQSDPAAYLLLMESPGLAGKVPNPDFQYDAVFPYAPELALEKWRDLETAGLARSDYFPLLEQAGREMLGPQQAETLAAFADELADHSVLRRHCLRAASQFLVYSEPARAAELLAASRDAGDDAGWLPDMSRLLSDWKATDPDKAAQWLSSSPSLDPDTRKRLARTGNLPMHPSEISNTPVTP